MIKMEFVPLHIREISLGPSNKYDWEMHGRAINELIDVLMSFIMSVYLVIEKAIEFDKVTISMPYVQSKISSDKGILTIIMNRKFWIAT